MIDYKFILVIIIAYLLGNISPSTIQAKKNGVDIKQEGSGNAGTTNAFRVLGAKAALITLLVDVGKGVLAVFIGDIFSTHVASMYCVLAVLLGHVFPVIYKFKGGKGVAVAFGATVAIDWRMGLCLLAIVLLVFVITRTVSMAALVGTISYPLVAYFFEPSFFYIGTVAAAIVLFMHRSNIIRIIHGDEQKIIKSRRKNYDE